MCVSEGIDQECGKHITMSKLMHHECVPTFLVSNIIDNIVCTILSMVMYLQNIH